MAPSIHGLIHLSLWALQGLVAFILLTSYGAMWREAQNNGKKGWFIALPWSLFMVILLNIIDGIDDYYHALRRDSP